MRRRRKSLGARRRRPGWLPRTRWRRWTVWALGAAVAAGAIAVIVVGALGFGRTRGGIDDGLPGSRCEPQPSRLTKPPEPGTRAGSFHGDYYELGEPIPPRQQAPLMLIIHGGGWTQDGPGQVESVRNQADMWRHRGWRTLNLDYHACGRSLGDVVALYDRFRTLANGHAVCAVGLSGGGQLALMLAAERPRVRCVIGYAALTDLPALPTQRTSGMLTGAAPSAGPLYAYNLAVAAFGANRLA